jgi:hypothetical protein
MSAILIVVTLLAVGAALFSARMAWRIAEQERRRSEARIAGLRTAVEGGPDAAVPDSVAPVNVNGLFERETETRVAAPWIAVGAAVVAGLLVGAAWTLGRSSDPPEAPATPAEITAPGRELPLELVALRDERLDDRLTIHGVVRNPSAGAGVAHVTAVVLLFNSQGGFVTSGRATIDRDALGPGAESAFAVTIRDAADVGRYRVSFRDDLRVIPHVDRRAS